MLPLVKPDDFISVTQVCNTSQVKLLKSILQLKTLLNDIQAES